MVKFLTLSFVASIFLAAIAFCMQDGWAFFICRWGAIAAVVAFVTTFFSGLMPRKLELETAEVGDRESVLTTRTRNFTQWQIKYDHLPKT